MLVKRLKMIDLGIRVRNRLVANARIWIQVQADDTVTHLFGARRVHMHAGFGFYFDSN
jgi:hypothetical protein